MSISLREHLDGLNTDLLKGWLKRVGAMEKGTTRKAQFIEAIERKLTADLAGVLQLMSLPERCLLAESAHLGRLLTAREFAARFGQPRPMPSHYYNYQQEPSLLTPFIALRGYDEEENALIASLAPALQARLTRPPSKQIATVSRIPKAWPSEQPHLGGDRNRPVRCFEGETIAPLELGRVLRLVQAGKVKVTDSTGRPTEATTRLIAEALVVRDVDLEIPDADRGDGWQRKYYTPCGALRAHAWPVLIQQCDWAKRAGTSLTLTKAGLDILQRFSPAMYREGIRRYLEDGSFDELNRINHIRGQSGKGKRWITDPVDRKIPIVEQIKQYPVGEWLAFSEAQRIVEADSGEWRVIEGEVQALTFFGPEFGYITDNTGLGRQFLRAFLGESLATLGLIDVAFVYPHHLWPDLQDSLAGDLPFCSRYDGLLFVRLNALGAYALDQVDHYERQAEVGPKLFRLLPNHDLVLTHTQLNPADRAALEMMAAPQSDCVWRLDVERILTHVETGGSLQGIQTFLTANVADGVPDNVQALLRELEGKLSACRSCSDAVLLEWTDEALARLIATSSGLRKLCFHAGANRVVVPADSLGAFKRAAKRLGYVLPRTGTAGPRGEPSAPDSPAASDLTDQS